MRYRDVERRLTELETSAYVESKANAGYAPEAWERLAQWALVVHDVGGWDEAMKRIKERGWYSDFYPEPGTGNGAGPMWDVTLFFQRGRDSVYPTLEEEQDILWLIAQLVDHLLGQGMPRAEIKTWDVGAECWDVVQASLSSEVES